MASKEIFETVTVIINLVGRSGAEFIFNTVTRQNVTPGEYKLLQRLHGKDNVKPVEGSLGLAVRKDAEGDERPLTNEDVLESLVSWYGPKVVDATFNDEHPDLPISFDEIRVSVKSSEASKSGKGKKNETGGDAGSSGSQQQSSAA